jgi:hypothetical protein
MAQKAKIHKAGEAASKPAVTRIHTTYPVRRIPYVPSAVRNMPFTIHPVKK